MSENTTTAPEVDAVDTTADTPTETSAPVIRKAPPVPLTLTVTLDEGVPEITYMPWETADVPRDGDELPDGTTFVSFNTKGDAVTVAALAQAAYAKDKSQVDLNAFDKAYRRFQIGFVQYGIVSRSNARLEDVLADAFMSVRLAIRLENGDPDYWGKSQAYRNLFDDRIRGFMRDQGFLLDETKRLLDNVRTNYVRRHETVINAVAVNEVVRGNVDKVNGVKKAEVQQQPDERGNIVPTVVITLDKQDKDGNNLVETWKPGDAKFPKALATAIKQVARRADGKADGPTTKRLPEKITGKPKAGGSGARANASGENERNYATEARDAIAAWVECIPHVAPLVMIGLLHEAETALSDFMLGAPGQKAPHSGLVGGPGVVGNALNAPGQLLIATGATLAHNAPKGNVAEWRFTPEGETKDSDAAAEDSGEDNNN